MDKNFELSMPLLLDNLHKIEKISIFDTIDSTNLYCKRDEVINSPAPYLIISKTQTNGRGRKDRTFYSPKDSGIYFSLVVDGKENINDSILITSISALSLCKAIRDITKKDAKIKWINDIYIDDKKVSGILCEFVKDKNNNDKIIIGVGINLFSVFNDDLINIAGNIGNVNKNELIISFINYLFDYYDSLPSRSFISEIKEYSNTLNKEICFIKDNKKYTGTAFTIDNNGYLHVKTNDEVIILNSGNISIKNNKYIK